MTQLEELLKILEKIIYLLESDGETHWSHWMRQSRDRLLNSDYSGIEKLLSAYGGMGSFKDLVVCQNYENGKLCWKGGYAEKNSELDLLRKKAWKLADRIRRESELE